MAVAESNMAEFKMPAIIKMSQNEWVKFFMQNGWIQDGWIQDGCHPQVRVTMNEWSFYLFKMVESKMAEFKMANIIKWSENEWVGVRLNLYESESEWSECVFEWIWEKITRCLNPRWQCLNPTWPNARWLQSSSWVRMNEWSFICSKWLTRRRRNSRWLTSSSWMRMIDVESDWISLSQNFVQNGWIQDGRIQDCCHHQVESKWMSEVFFCSKWLNPRWQIQVGRHDQVEWEWMTLSQIELVWVRVLCKMAKFLVVDFMMDAIIRLIRLN